MKQLPPWLLDELPSHETASYIPQKYDDSTHKLWLIKGKKFNLFLKVCSNTSSPFWKVIKHLFELNLSSDISSFHQQYSYIDKNTRLQVPELIKAKSSNADTVGRNAFILTSEISGNVIEEPNLMMVGQLAEHLAALHHKNNDQWGTLHKPIFNQQQWRERISDTLQSFAKQEEVPERYLNEALGACQYIISTQFIPLMPDLRWDQFLQKDDQLYALVDLDAFVLAPRELDFVLLEYILAPDQLSHFIQSYTNEHPIPDISKVRPAYRLLLFLMQVLGEQKIDDWMNSECYF